MDNGVLTVREELIQKELASLRQEVDIQGIRLNIAEAWLGLYRKAYDALQQWGVNFKGLKEYEGGYPTYNGTSGRDSVDKLPASKARDVYITWIGKIGRAIDAAVKRKQWKVHETPPNDTLQ